MFARRHPVLFFFIMISSCCTLVIIGFLLLALAGTRMMGSAYSQVYDKGQGNIGVIEIEGVILSSKKIINDIKTFHEDERIKAIVLRIDSPGGGIGPSQEIYREINKIKKDKLIVSSMGSVAASGGYYIACATSKIFANPGTITGSIGVIMEYANIMEIAKKIGISPVVIKSGEFKDMGSPLRQLKDAERKMFQSLVDELHQQFVTDVAAARKIPVPTIEVLADGRVYTGQKALTLNLIDSLGNLEDAIQMAGELANIKGKIIPVYLKEDRMTFIKKLADTLFKDINISGTVTDNFRYVIN
ncbi:MAG: signal peptide peptidase SppA [Proteobacteria bacterium]|nr:signal peptide peptidase SppA [Pseudomonadota bacterium]MBU1389175.1 signal peptide peptidase SppA [Pseudomonadota bacterium]MBU1543399.1 signal peptide peptidase SppA [Pseudomonadota bacterium]MBU2482906.1 signal peptide peptidase SppA [Pseudomonadota bacterium]